MMDPMAPRRANRTGNFRLRADGRWEGRVFVAGLGHHSVYGPTREAVEKALASRTGDLEAGIRPPDGRMTVDEWLDEWLRVHCANLARSTRGSYADVARLYIRPAIGDQRLARLSPAHVARMLDAHRAAGKLGPTTIRYVYAVLRIALGRAVKAGRIGRNVCDLIDPPPAGDTEIRILTVIDTARLLDALAESPHECLILVTLATGMRESEVCGLWYSDLDLGAGTVAIRAQLERGTERRIPPKARSRRTIHLPALAVASLRTHRARAIEANMAAGAEWTEDRWIFTGRGGRPIQGWTAYRSLQGVLAAAGLPKVTFHSLRHSFATTLLAEGEELANVSKILGHADYSTTADVYSHLTPKITRRAADITDAALRRRAR